MNTQAQVTDTFDAWAARHGVGYSAEFVPFSRSRNAKPNATIRDMQINWRVTFTKDGRAFSTDYQQSIGHLPLSVRQPWKGADSTLSRIVVAHEPIILAALETGNVQTESRFTRGKLDPPTPADVLECLALDAGVLDASTFEEWAGEYGYDADSREAERIYNECRNAAQRMLAVFGHKAMAELRAIEA
jgi:hypothetical protein